VSRVTLFFFPGAHHAARENPPLLRNQTRAASGCVRHANLSRLFPVYGSMPSPTIMARISLLACLAVTSLVANADPASHRCLETVFDETFDRPWREVLRSWKTS